jgi:DNA-binding LacI/PurR family transcriptional regulator
VGTTADGKRVDSRRVAAEAGVSRSTVSLVLNGRTDARIPEATRRRVLEAAERLNYSRNASAVALVTGKTNRVGLVPISPVCLIDRHSYYGGIITGVMEATVERDYNLLFHAARYPDWKALFADIVNGSVDGVLLIGRRPDDPLAPALIDARFPTVCVSFQPDHPGFVSVDCDNEWGGYLAVRHLLSLGHRRVAFLANIGEGSWVRDRHAGALRAIQEAGRTAADLPCIDTSGLSLGESAAAGRIVADFLRLSPRPSALFQCDESTLTALREALEAHGIRIPEDLAVVGFNSTENCDAVHPRLTAVYQPLREIGTAAFELLHDRMAGRDVAPGTRRFPVRLDVRESCGAKVRATQESQR